VQNRLWGAERIRGELLKLGIRLSKRTIQKYLRRARPPRQRGQKWSTFLHNHAQDIWACDFVTVTDLFFRPIYAFVLIELVTRRVVHVGVSRYPTDHWLAQQLRQATPFDQRPTYLVRDNDARFGSAFARVAESSGIEVQRTPYKAPRAGVNPIHRLFLSFGAAARRSGVAVV
jgi:putative transposase